MNILDTGIGVLGYESDNVRERARREKREVEGTNRRRGDHHLCDRRCSESVRESKEGEMRR